MSATGDRLASLSRTPGPLRHGVRGALAVPALRLATGRARRATAFLGAGPPCRCSHRINWICCSASDWLGICDDATWSGGTPPARSGALRQSRGAFRGAQGIACRCGSRLTTVAASRRCCSSPARWAARVGGDRVVVIASAALAVRAQFILPSHLAAGKSSTPPTTRFRSSVVRSRTASSRLDAAVGGLPPAAERALAWRYKPRVRRRARLLTGRWSGALAALVFQEPVEGELIMPPHHEPARRGITAAAVRALEGPPSGARETDAARTSLTAASSATRSRASATAVPRHASQMPGAARVAAGRGRPPRGGAVEMTRRPSAISARRERGGREAVPDLRRVELTFQLDAQSARPVGSAARRRPAAPRCRGRPRARSRRTRASSTTDSLRAASPSCSSACLPSAEALGLTLGDVARQFGRPSRRGCAAHPSARARRRARGGALPTRRAARSRVEKLRIARPNGRRCPSRRWPRRRSCQGCSAIHP